MHTGLSVPASSSAVIFSTITTRGLLVVKFRHARPSIPHISSGLSALPRLLRVNTARVSPGAQARPSAVPSTESGGGGWGWGGGWGGGFMSDGRCTHWDEFALERVVLAGFSSRFCEEGSDGRECLSLVTGALGPGTQTSQAREPAASTAQPSPLPLQACGAACGSFSLISPTLQRMHLKLRVVGWLLPGEPARKRNPRFKPVPVRRLRLFTTEQPTSQPLLLTWSEERSRAQ